MLFIFQFSCLFTFCKHKQSFAYILKKPLKIAKGHIPIWVSNKRSRHRKQKYVNYFSMFVFVYSL
jgi:hypothetical protein